MLAVELFLLAELLAEEMRLRHGGAQLADELLLHAAVVLGHDVARPGLVFGEDVVRLQHQGGGPALGFAHEKADLVNSHIS